MNFNIWGIVMTLIGLFLFISGLRESDFFIYSLLATKSKMLWGKNVHKFYQTVGAIIIIVGIAMTLKVI